jgi:hypothetical protein
MGRDVVLGVLTRFRLCDLLLVKTIPSSEASGMTKTVKIAIETIVAGEGAEVGNGSEEKGKQTENEQNHCCAPRKVAEDWDQQGQPWGC